MPMLRGSILTCLAASLALATGGRSAETVDFVRDVASLFQQHCIRCQNEAQRSGELSAAEPLIFEMRAGMRLETIVSTGSNFRVSSKIEGKKWSLTGTVHKVIDEVVTISATAGLSHEDYRSSVQVSEAEFKINDLSNTPGGAAWGGIHARFWIRRGVDPVPVLIEILDRRKKSFGEAALYFTELEAGPQKAATPHLVDALNDGIDHSGRPPYERIRVAAAEVLGKFGGNAKAAVPALVQRLKDKNGYVRAEAAVALWKIEQHAAAVPALKAELNNEAKGIRTRAAFGLRSIGADSDNTPITSASPDPFDDASAFPFEKIPSCPGPRRESAVDRLNKVLRGKKGDIVAQSR